MPCECDSCASPCRSAPVYEGRRQNRRRCGIHDIHEDTTEGPGRIRPGDCTSRAGSPLGLGRPERLALAAAHLGRATLEQLLQALTRRVMTVAQCVRGLQGLRPERLGSSAGGGRPLRSRPGRKANHDGPAYPQGAGFSRRAVETNRPVRNASNLDDVPSELGAVRPRADERPRVNRGGVVTACQPQSSLRTSCNVPVQPGDEPRALVGQGARHSQVTGARADWPIDHWSPDMVGVRVVRGRTTHDAEVGLCLREAGARHREAAGG